MKKLNLKSKIIIWVFLLLLALSLLVVCSIIISNSQYIIKLNNYVKLEPTIFVKAKAEIALSIGLIFFSLIIIGMGSYIVYALKVEIIGQQYKGEKYD